MSDIICSPGSIVVPRKPIKIMRQWVLTPPVLGCLKINIVESFLGSSGHGGIGALIKDLEGNILIQFSKEVRVDLAVYVEVQALR